MVLKEEHLSNQSTVYGILVPPMCYGFLPSYLSRLEEMFPKRLSSHLGRVKLSWSLRKARNEFYTIYRASVWINWVMARRHVQLVWQENVQPGSFRTQLRNLASTPSLNWTLLELSWNHMTAYCQSFSFVSVSLYLGAKALFWERSCPRDSRSHWSSLLCDRGCWFGCIVNLTGFFWSFPMNYVWRLLLSKIY